MFSKTVLLHGKKGTRVIDGDTIRFYWHGIKNYDLHQKVTWNAVYFIDTICNFCPNIQFQFLFFRVG